MSKLSKLKCGGIFLLLLVGAGTAAQLTLPSELLGKLGQVGRLSTAGAEQLSTSLPAMETASNGPALGHKALGQQSAGTQVQPSVPRVFSPSTPLVWPVKSSADAGRLAELPQRDSEIVRRPATGFVAPLSAEGSRRLASSKPTDDDARRELTRDLQTELKRVGCFEGDINGTWSPASKKAMTAFMDRVNATLPVEDPDYILLTLVQGHAAQACGKGCPAGQGLSNDGRCQPRAILAQSARKSDDRKVTDRNEKRLDAINGNQKSEVAPVQTGSISKPSVSAAGNSGAWTTATTVQAPAPMAQIILPPAPVVPPLPGRMAMGAPVPSPDEGARLDDLEARKRRAQAALIDEQKLQAKEQVEAERINSERLMAEAQRRDQQLQAVAAAERKKNDQPLADVDRREKQVAAADARRSAQRQAEALEASATATNSGGETSNSDNKSADVNVKFSDAAKLGAVIAAVAADQEANDRRTAARRTRDAREQGGLDRERRVTAVVPQVAVRAPPVQVYRPTVYRAPPTPRPAAEQRWTRTIFDASRSR